jgi:hypothetical protein
VKERSISVLKPQVPQRTMPLRVYDKPKGAESRSFVEKESLPERKVRPSEAKKGDVKGGQEPEKIRRQRELEKKTSERLQERPGASPQSLPPRQGETPQRSVIEQRKPRDTQQKGTEKQIKEKGAKPQEAPRARDIPPRVPDRSLPEAPSQKRTVPETKGQRESGERRVPGQGSGERDVRKAPGSEPRTSTPAAPQEKRVDTVRPNGERGKGTTPKASDKSPDEEERKKRAREREKVPGGQPSSDSRR